MTSNIMKLGMIMCSEGKERQTELRGFDLFVRGGRSGDSALSDSDSSDQESYTCPCGKTFKRKAPYQRHMDISHSKLSHESHSCSVCGKTFGKRSVLTMHMSIHRTSDENQQRFTAMETRSTRSQSYNNHNQSELDKLHVIKVQSSSPAKVVKNSNSVSKDDSSQVDTLKVSQTVLSSYRTRSKDKAYCTDRVKTRSSSRESSFQKHSIKTRSSSREKNFAKPKLQASPRVPVSKARSSPRVITRRFEVKNLIGSSKFKRIPKEASSLIPAHNKVCSRLTVTENNNNLTCCPGDKIKGENQVSKTPDISTTNSTAVTTSNLVAVTNDSNTDLNASQDSDKENNDVCITNNSLNVSQVQLLVKTEKSYRSDNNQNKTKDSYGASAQSIPSGSLNEPASVTVETRIKTEPIDYNNDSTVTKNFNIINEPGGYEDHTNDNSSEHSKNIKSEANISASTSILTASAKPVQIKAKDKNSIHVTSESQFQSREKKANTQTIVIVIREAKPGRQKTTLGSSSVPKQIEATKQTELLPSTSKTLSHSQRVAKSISNLAVSHTKLGLMQSAMAIAQPQVAASSAHALMTSSKSIPIMIQTSAPSSQVPTNSVLTPTILAPNTAGVLNRSDVPRTIASVAPSIVSSAPRLVAVKNHMDINDYNTQEGGATESSHDSGESTESDEGGNDEFPPTRKSARLDGKIPGWKKIMEGEGVWSQDNRQRKRKFGRPRADEYSGNSVGDTKVNALEDDLKLHGAAQELLSVVAEDVDIDDDELTDMSTQLFSRRQRIYRDEHTCDICGKSFTTEKYLQMHSSLHGAATPARNLVAENYKANDFRELDGFKSSWTCKICNKVFAQNSSFKNHMRTHSDERPFVCDICSIGFKERYHLKKHMLFKHSDELKEKCQFCGKRFKDSTAVRAHERIHSDHRPYHCRRCGKAFKTSECLWHHENRSKTCGALGGPPLPPLPKKGRVSRKPRITPTVAVSTPVSTHVPPSSNVRQVSTVQKSHYSHIPVKSEPENTRLELVQQIIQSDNGKQAIQHSQQFQVTNIQRPPFPFNGQFINSDKRQNNGSQLLMVPTSTGAQLTTAKIELPNVSQILSNSIGQPQVLTPVPVGQSQHQQQIVFSQSQVKPTNSAAVNVQGSQVVFSVPNLKEGNTDAAAQVTKAILDAISNTTGQMKGVNIQKTIQCAVNQVQEVIEVNQNQSPSVPSINVKQTLNIPPQAQNAGIQHLIKTEPFPQALPAQGLRFEDGAIQNHIAVRATSGPGEEVNGFYSKTSQALPATSTGIAVSSSTTSHKPYTVSILPPISTVAQALRESIPSSGDSKQLNKPFQGKMEPEEDYISSDSDDGDSLSPEEEEELSLSTSKTLPSTEGTMTTAMTDGKNGASQTSSRPVATVQPLRRGLDLGSRHPSTDSDISSNSETQSTCEPYIVQPQRNKQSNYTCPKCQKGFAVPSAYQKHLLKHEEVRPFRCNTCDIGFKLKVHLKKHNLYRHSDAYPCECSICGKRFKDSSAVRLHERIHSEDRPFECGCGKSFKTKENLWGHQNRKMCPYAGQSPPARSPEVPPAISCDDMVSKSQDFGNKTYDINSNKADDQTLAANITFQNNAVFLTSSSEQINAHTSPLNTNPSIMISQPKEECKEQFDSHSPGTGHSVALPSFDTFSSLAQLNSRLEVPKSLNPNQLEDLMNTNAIYLPIKKESMAEQCPTIQSLLRKAPNNVTKLPGIQQLFKHHIKPPPPYPGHMTPPRFAEITSTGSSPEHAHQSGSNNCSPQQSITSSPAKSSFSRQNSQSPVSSLNVTRPNTLLNIDQLYSSALTKDPFLRSPCLPSGRKGSDLYSPSTPSSEYCPVSLGIPKSPRSPRSCTAVSPAPSQCSEVGFINNVTFWDDECDRKPVLTQWQNADSDTLFMELSTNVLSQI